MGADALTWARGRGDRSELEPVAAEEVVSRQGRRTQLTEDATRAFLAFDRPDGLSLDELHGAVDELSRLLRDRWPSCRLERLKRAAG